MKSERRHELKTNTLSAWMQFQLPVLWQKYGNHVLMGLIILIALFWVMKWRREAPIKAKAEASMRMYDLQMQMRQAYESMNPENVTDIPQKVSLAMEISDDPDIQAQGYMMLGEYHWLNAVSNYPDIVAEKKTTDPLFEESLKKADEAYVKVLELKTGQRDMAAKANIGRAKVAEELGSALYRSNPQANNPYWETARKGYQAVIDDKQLPETLRIISEVRMKQLKELENPLWAVERKMPTTGPTTGPTTEAVDPTLFVPTGPVEGPKSQPATRP